MQMSVKFLLLCAVLALLGCNRSSVITMKNGVIPNKATCLPHSRNVEELKRSQMACHRGVAGKGTQVLIESTQWELSFKSDTAMRQLLSIFIEPEVSARRLGAVKFAAFYSDGQYELSGKAGCVGVLEDGLVEVKPGQRLAYELTFRLVSPLSWKGDCDGKRHFEGEIDLSENSRD